MTEVERLLSEFPEDYGLSAVRHTPNSEVAQRCTRCGLMLSEEGLTNWKHDVIEFKGGLSVDNGNWIEANNCSEEPS